ncbi:hypothetical protein GCM10023331_13190 [Algivirga pacifica]|uniref:Phosphodiester glycosidase domain-containing protein n=2 Tax=Algivirga pacifica TaxID=1162670 RepID=A0ABP9D724_9BACT
MITAAQSPFMRQFMQKYQGRRDHNLLVHFDYKGYLEKVPFTDFTSLQKDRLYFWRLLGDGDIFLYCLGDKFLKYYPVNLQNASQMIDIGEMFLVAQAKGINDRNRIPYTMMGYFVLGKVARCLEAAHEQKKIDLTAREGGRLVQRLKRNKITVRVETSSAQKIIKNLKQGNLVYVLERGLEKTKINALSRKADSYLENLETYIPMELQGVLGQPLVGANSSTSTTMGLTHYRSFLKRTKGYGTTLWKVDSRGEEVGYAVWMERPSVKAHYVIDGRLNSLAAWRKKGKLLLATTGGFTNNYKSPEGLTVEKGRVINAVLLHDRDGLVVVLPNGGIRVINLKESELHLPDGQGGLMKVANPLRSLMAYSQLMNWARQTNATFFQTQLMAFSDQLLINPNLASGKHAERRFLALVSDRQGNVQHIIFHIPKPYALAPLTAEIYQLLKSKALKVEAILNLDTGGQNVLFVHEPGGRQIPAISGTLPAHRTTNLLLFTY